MIHSIQQTQNLAYNTPATPASSSQIQNTAANARRAVMHQHDSTITHDNQDDLLRSIDRLVEQLSVLNAEKSKKLNEKLNSNPDLNNHGQPNLNALVDSIRSHTEQNKFLNKVFSELERELRTLTDSRLALEIQLDYLNTAGNTATSNNAGNVSAPPPATPKTSLTNTNSASIQAAIVAAAAGNAVSGTVSQTPSLPQSTSNPINLSAKVLQLENITQTPQSTNSSTVLNNQQLTSKSAI
jgi:hypothetical protein